MGKVYGVKRGRQPGLYNSWKDCESQVKGYPKASYKSFATKELALQWLHETTSPAQTQPEESSHDYTIVWTDGSALGNNSGKNSGSRAGSGVFFAPGDIRNISARLPGSSQTNQRAEIYAAILAIEAVGFDQPLEIRTDSQYLINEPAMTKWIHAWKKNGNNTVNADLFNHLYDLCSKCKTSPRFIYVPAHTGIEGNENADKLAKEGALKPRHEPKADLKSSHQIETTNDIPQQTKQEDILYYHIIMEEKTTKQKESIGVYIAQECHEDSFLAFISKNNCLPRSTFVLQQDDCFTFRFFNNGGNEIDFCPSGCLVASWILLYEYLTKETIQFLCGHLTHTAKRTETNRLSITPDSLFIQTNNCCSLLPTHTLFLFSKGTTSNKKLC